MNSEAVVAALAGLATGMATLTAVTVRWAAFSARPLRASVVQFLLLMMAGMLTGILVYFAIGGSSGFVAGFWVAGAIMSASVVVVFVAFLREVRAPASGAVSPETLPHRSSFVASVVGLVLLNEFLMGWSFSLLAGWLPTGAGGARLLPVLTGAIVSPWFVFPMALEMVLTLQWLTRAVPRSLVRYLWIQPAAMACSPPTVAGLPWVIGTAVADSVLMAIAVFVLLLHLARGVDLPSAIFAYAWRLIISFGLMGAGLYVWVAYGNLELFAVSLLVQMLLFLHVSTDPWHYRGPTPAPAASDGTRGQAPGVPTT